MACCVVCPAILFISCIYVCLCVCVCVCVFPLLLSTNKDNDNCDDDDELYPIYTIQPVVTTVLNEQPLFVQPVVKRV